jgi:hypothetical protein
MSAENLLNLTIKSIILGELLVLNGMLAKGLKRKSTKNVTPTTTP